MAAILSMILGFFGKILSEVLTNVLSTPAKQTTVETAEGVLDPIATPSDDLLDQFGGLFDRS